MSISPLPTVLCALAAVGLPAAGARPVDDMIIAGSDTAVWLIRRDTANRNFDLAIRKADGNWHWVHEAVSGIPAAAVASPTQLHVLFASPAGHMIFDQETGSRTTALMANHPLWPGDAAPLAMCEALDANAAAQGEVLAVVARPTWVAATAPAASEPAAITAVTTVPSTARTEPAGLDGSFHLGLFRRVGTQWEHVADWRQARLVPAARVLAATTGKGVYVLVTGRPGEQSRLRRWDGSAWHELKLQGPPADGPVVAMLGVREGKRGNRQMRRLILLLAGASTDASRRELKIATFDEERESFTLQTMLHGDTAATWPADELPQVARMGDQMALIWRDGESLRFGTCVPHMGQLTAKGEVDVFARPRPGDTGQSLLTGFMWVVLLAVFVPMLLFRPRGGPRPFSLPENLQTGHLGKRLVAAIIDFVPINLLVVAAYRLTPSALTLDEIGRLLEQMGQDDKVQVPIGLAIASISTMVLYVTYCTVMELRVGMTFGKKLMKLRVVGPEGREADFRQCLLRNLLKFIELLSLRSPLFFLVPLIPIFTRYRQRFGDLIAHTSVVDNRTWAPPEEPPDETDQHTDHQA